MEVLNTKDIKIEELAKVIEQMDYSHEGIKKNEIQMFKKNQMIKITLFKQDFYLNDQQYVDQKKNNLLWIEFFHK